MMSYTGSNSFTEENRFIVVYPEGVQNSWNVGFIGGSTAEDVGFISALIDTLHKEYYIGLDRVCVTGISNAGL